MPWTGKTFKKKHDKELTDSQAKKAAEIANSILDESGDEGVAIATAIKLVKNKPKKTKKAGVTEACDRKPYRPKKVAESDISKREDTKPKYGVKKYGDVKFADDRNKKYPIHDEEHIRAAWNYINKDANAAKYSAEDLKTIKKRIIKAWKKKIDKEGPPAAQEAKEQTKEKK